MEHIDITIIGAGVVGLAIAAQLASEKRTVAVLEKNPKHGQETSSRNSEVIHAGIYHVPETLKAKFCVRGNRLLSDYCKKHSVPFKITGKIITAYEPTELPKLEKLLKRGLADGAGELKIIDSREITRLEPAIRALSGILSPSTGILSADTLMDKLLEEAVSKGAMLITKCRVCGIDKTGEGYELRTDSQEPFVSRIVINAAGLNADKIAEMAGIDIDKTGYRQTFIKGEYFRLKHAPQVSRLIYPLPDEMSLGIHLTPDLKGRLRLGPSSFRVDKIDYDVDTGHMPLFLGSARHYFPDTTPDMLEPDTSGIRPRLAVFSGEHPDFIIVHEKEKGLPGFINLIGIESPGLTSALAIAEYLKNSLLYELL